VLDAVARLGGERSSVAVVDLACGLGSTLRACTERLPQRQSWRLVDNDLSLLARAAGLAQAARPDGDAGPVDLARDLEAALDGPVELVTTSALLDLVSHDWLDRLVTESAARRLPVYAALSYDGLATLDPVDRSIPR
jgi:trans-aconitate methyltransferase